MYKTWLFNNKKKKERKDMIKYGRKWTPMMVIYQQNQEEVLKRIEDESGAKPGAPGMFKHYQAADELEKAKEIAEEWSNNFPPPEVQAQVTWKKGLAYMEHFLKEMWRQCRMRVFVLSAWKNEQGEVLFGMHDDNEALGDGDSFMKTKDWEAIKTVWQEYAQEQFGARAWDRGRHVKGGWKRIRKLAFELEADGDGMLVILDITKMKLEEKKAIDFVSGMTRWSFHGAPSYTVKMMLLNFWYAWQEAGKCLTFLFKAWKNKDGEMVPSVVSSKSPSPATKTIRKWKRAIHQSPEDSLTEAQSNTQETEEEADDDLADSKSPHKRDDLE
ncbi:hypothetical protein BDR04DRAFT_1203928 [Suillus decipiens]|nr:hypothetical protein BDR04DRAFT_1203928 [Suillus decipiens]